MDCYYAYISLMENPKQALFIKDANIIKQMISGINRNDVLNITGLGRLRVLTVEKNIYPDNTDEDTRYHEIGLTCEWLCDAWTPSETAWIESLAITAPPEQEKDAPWLDSSLEALAGGGIY